jgi:hypothetical protein
MRTCLTFAFLTLCTGSCAFSMAEQTLRTQNESFSAANVSAVRLETGPGSLQVTGIPGALSIEVTAEFKANLGSQSDTKRILDNLKLTMETRGDTFYLKSEQLGDWHWGDSGRIDLTISVPSAVRLDIDDGSGSMSVKGMGRDVRIEDGSGEIDVDGVEGNLVVNDGSGSIWIRNVKGEVEIEDGSGGIDIAHVGRSVRIDDGSGSIDVEDVAGDLVIPHDGSGSIHHRDVRGRLDLPRRR